MEGSLTASRSDLIYDLLAFFKQVSGRTVEQSFVGVIVHCCLLIDLDIKLKCKSKGWYSFSFCSVLAPHNRIEENIVAFLFILHTVSRFNLLPLLQYPNGVNPSNIQTPSLLDKPYSLIYFLSF